MAKKISREKLVRPRSITRSASKATSARVEKVSRSGGIRLWFVDDELKLGQLHKYVDDRQFSLAEVSIINPVVDGAEAIQAFQNQFLDSDLVLLDHEFQGRQSPLAPPDGAGYVSHLRSLARRDTARRSPPPIVILTGAEEAFSNEVPAIGPEFPLSGSFVGKEALIAPALDVEWILFKDDGKVKDKISSIALNYRAVKKLYLDNGLSLEELCSFMKLPKANWRQSAVASVTRARPPVSNTALYNARGAAAIISWLLQEALRFPGALISDLQLEAITGLKIERIDDLVLSGKESRLAAALKATCYRGPFNEIVSRRWWSAGIDDLCLRFSTELRPNAKREKERVVYLNADLGEGGLAKIDDCLPVQPRGWPQAAMQAFMKIKDLCSNEMAQSMVDPNDASLLKGENR